MFGLGKKKEDKKEMQEIKQQVSRPIVPEIPTGMPEIEKVPMQLGSQPAAPLFVKVNDYKDLVNRIVSLKEFVKTCKNLIEKDKQIDITRENIRNELEENMGNIETIISQIRKNIPIPEETKNINHYQESEKLTGLESELERLKEQTAKFK